jgi:hypothetical protein
MSDVKSLWSAPTCYPSAAAADQPVREEQAPQSGKGLALTFILISLYLIVLVCSVLLARKNLKMGRAAIVAELPVWRSSSL